MKAVFSSMKTQTYANMENCVKGCFENEKEHSDVAEQIMSDDVNNSVNSVTEVREEATTIEDEPRKILDVDDIDDTSFLNLSQDDKLSSANFSKCEMCDFAAATKTCINDHKEENHNWC